MKATIKTMQGTWADCTTENGDRVIIKMLDSSQHKVGEQVNWNTEYAATKPDGTIAYTEIPAPTCIGQDGNQVPVPECDQFSQQEYLIALVEVMAVAVFEAAEIKMDLEAIRLLATAQAAKNRG